MRVTALILLVLIVTMTSQNAMTRETMAKDIAEPATTNPASLMDEDETRLPDTQAGSSTTVTGTAVNTYQQDLVFLKDHSEVIELKHQYGDARLSLVPAWQGRVMTSATTADGTSYGWLNYDLIEAGVVPKEQRQGLDAHIYVFGGEDRFWIGPEGGQFSSYFSPGSAFDFENWFVPAFIDTNPWELVSRSETRAMLRHEEKVTNWSGHTWDMRVEREIILLEESQLEKELGTDLSNTVKVVAYETVNTISNVGDQAWDETTGMPSIWILGMMKHGPETTVVIPFKTRGDGLGIAVTDDYFGKVPAERLLVNEANGVLYFSADGNYRSKIGISPQRSKGVAGSWDALNKVMTIVEYNRPPSDQAQYVNSLWEMQEAPFQGDAINSYNDGPVDGGQLGPFYEIETSSPALGLGAGDSYTHLHRTIHLEGSQEALDRIALEVFGVGIAEIEAALE